MNQVPFAYYLDQARHSQLDTVANRLVLKNRGIVSIQASSHHYCEPRSTQKSYRFYTEFELGMPQNCDLTEDLKQYAEDPEDYSGTVYGRVPISVIDEFLEANGGIVGYTDINSQSTRMKVIEIQADQVDVAQWIIETS